MPANLCRRLDGRRVESARHGEQLNCNRAEPMPELARQRADGVIDRSKTRDTPCFPLAAKGRLGVWTRIAETILASVHVRARKQAEHMDASDLIRALPK